MYFENEINKQRIDTISYKLVYEFCEVLSYDGKKKLTNVKFVNRPGNLVDCLILGSLTPKKGDRGIIFFVGKYNTPVFKNFNSFLSTGNTKPGEDRKESYFPPKMDLPNPNTLPNASGLINLYVCVHSWNPAILQEFYKKKVLVDVFRKGGGTIKEALNAATNFNATADGDSLILLGLNDVGSLSAVTQALLNMQKLIDLIKAKKSRGNIYVCNISAAEDYSNLSNCSAFNVGLLNLTGAYIIDIYEYCKSQKYEFTKDRFHLANYKGLGKYLASIIDK